MRLTMGTGRWDLIFLLAALASALAPSAVAHHSPYPFSRAEVVKAKRVTGADRCVGTNAVGSKFRHIRCVFVERGEAVTFHRLSSGKVTITKERIPRNQPTLPYPWTGSGHWITSIRDTGQTIRLEDRSLWRVASYDRYTSRFWLVVDDITVLHDVGNQYRLINTSEDEAVDATYLGRE